MGRTWEAEGWRESSGHHGGVGEGFAFCGVGGGDRVDDGLGLLLSDF